MIIIIISLIIIIIIISSSSSSSIIITIITFLKEAPGLQSEYEGLLDRWNHCVSFSRRGIRPSQRTWRSSGPGADSSCAWGQCRNMAYLRYVQAAVLISFRHVTTDDTLVSDVVSKWYLPFHIAHDMSLSIGTLETKPKWRTVYLKLSKPIWNILLWTSRHLKKNNIPEP